MNRLALALAVALALAPARAHAWMLNAIVKANDGTPSILGYSYGEDRQACLAAMKAIQKMQSEAVIVQACTPEGQAQQAQASLRP
jgi:hypothetical protein